MSIEWGSKSFIQLWTTFKWGHSCSAIDGQQLEEENEERGERERHAESAEEALLTSLGTFRRISFYVTGALARLERRRDLRAAIYSDAWQPAKEALEVEEKE